MFQYGKEFAKELGDCIRMCMFVACGVAENKYKQPQFDESSTEDSIYYKLTSMINDGKFNEAENAMYEWLNPGEINDYYTMLCVYDYMNEFDEQFIESNNYTRDEIREGVEEISKGRGLLY